MARILKQNGKRFFAYRRSTKKIRKYERLQNIVPRCLLGRQRCRG